jgi:hypothetical protein
MMMEVIPSSEMSLLTRGTLRQIPEDDVLHVELFSVRTNSIHTICFLYEPDVDNDRISEVLVLGRRSWSKMFFRVQTMK